MSNQQSGLPGQLMSDVALAKLWELIQSLVTVSKTSVSVNRLLTDGTKIATLTVDGQQVDIYCRSYSNMVAATSSKAGGAGLVPAPSAGDQQKVLNGAGQFVSVTEGITQADLDVVASIFNITI